MSVTAEDLERAEHGYRFSVEMVEDARVERNRLVREAIAQGWTHAQVAAATELSRARVGQLASRGSDGRGSSWQSRGEAMACSARSAGLSPGVKCGSAKPTSAAGAVLLERDQLGRGQLVQAVGRDPQVSSGLPRSHSFSAQ